MITIRKTDIKKYKYNAETEKADFVGVTGHNFIISYDTYAAAIMGLYETIGIIATFDRYHDLKYIKQIDNTIPRYSDYSWYIDNTRDSFSLGIKKNV